VPHFVRRAMIGALRGWRTSDVEARVRHERLARNIADAADPPRTRFVAKQQTVFRRDELREISPFLAPHCSEATDRDLFHRLFDERLGPLEAMALWQQTTSLPDDMLFKVDRMSMAHSLEVRTPFLDHRIAELLNRVAFSVKLRGGRTKNILKKAMSTYFPADFVNRPKQGFTLPLAAWFKDDLNSFARSRLLRREAVVPHVIGRMCIERLITEHERLERDWSNALWTLLIFESWCGRRRLGPEILQSARSPNRSASAQASDVFVAQAGAPRTCAQEPG
jgi:asparagine synthetase B (glutamine-hydrolysing)